MSQLKWPPGWLADWDAELTARLQSAAKSNALGNTDSTADSACLVAPRVRQPARPQFPKIPIGWRQSQGPACAPLPLRTVGCDYLSYTAKTMLTVELSSSRCEFTIWQPSDGRIFDAFAFDTETTEIVESRPDLVPYVVLATAYDGERGVLIHRDDLLAFFEAHVGVRFIGHNIAFDLAVCQKWFGERHDIYSAVEDKSVWCTMILHQVHALATVGNSARDECSLQHCVQQHLDIHLPKDVRDADGRHVRVNFGRYLGTPLASIPPESLRYAARDTMSTWALFHALKAKIRDVLSRANEVYGYVSDDWRHGVVDQFGPLTHHLQLRASIVLDDINRQGLCVDRDRQRAKLARVVEDMQANAARLTQAGFVFSGPGSANDLQQKLDHFHRQHPDILLKTTEWGKWSTKAENLAPLGEYDEHFRELSTFRATEKLKNSYLDKMERDVVYPKYGILATTGRTSCRGGFNLQSLPREVDATGGESSIRGCFVPRPGHVFIDSDYSQIELVVLGHVWKHADAIWSSLFNLVNDNQDLHRRIAASVLNKPPGEITKAERAAAKPVSFGRPGGMVAKSLQEYARKSYGLSLSIEEVEQCIAAYHRLCPELDRHLQEEVDAGAVLAEALQMTPDEYHQAIGNNFASTNPEQFVPQGWLGGMFLKTLGGASPTTKNGRPFAPEELSYFWHKAQQLVGQIDAETDRKLQSHEPSVELCDDVRNWAGRRPVITSTGRLRANASFCSARNNLFQGVAADGAVCALWQLWREGYRIVAFVHDQVVIECPADDRVLERKAHIENLLIAGMHTVIPGTLVKVETVITTSLDKADVDPRYAGGTPAQPAATQASSCAEPCDASAAGNAAGNAGDVLSCEAVPGERCIPP